MSKTARLAAALVLLAFGPSVAFAAQQETYSQLALKHAQDSGKPVVVDVTATWCTTCAAQAPIVHSLLEEPRFKDLVLLHVDFDTQKAALHALNVRQQSTFVVFKGKREVGRSTGDTDRAAIQALFDKAN